jgi:hypothetical protein
MILFFNGQLSASLVLPLSLSNSTITERIAVLRGAITQEIYVMFLKTLK